jgi:PTH1 family peptidyl-tRNA hydrolase
MFENLVVVGLGNPGSRYAPTRHNLGFRVVDRLAAAHRVRSWEERRTCVVARIARGSAGILLVKPHTYMNLSGMAIAELRSERELAPEEILVVVDDIALPLGQLRLRRRGSDGGHNGLKSVISELGTSGFPRLRLGIGPLPEGVDAAEYVLGAFAAEEESTAEEMVSRAARCVETVFYSGFDRAMGEFNAPETEGETG